MAHEDAPPLGRPETSPAFADAWAAWLAYRRAGPRPLRLSTLADYESAHRRYLGPFFDDLPLDAIDGAGIARFVVWASGHGISPKRLSNVLVPLRACLRWHHRMGMLSRDGKVQWILKCATRVAHHDGDGLVDPHVRHNQVNDAVSVEIGGRGRPRVLHHVGRQRPKRSVAAAEGNYHVAVGILGHVHGQVENIITVEVRRGGDNADCAGVVRRQRSPSPVAVVQRHP